MAYIDGALQRNNPVQLLEEERRAIWGNTITDIVLSIGTGIQADHLGATKTERKKLKVAKKLIPKGLRGKVAVGLDIVQSTLDCDRQWNEFVSSHPEIERVCHRLNIGLSERPPRLDDVPSMFTLKQQAEQYLRKENRRYLDSRYQSAYAHIQIIVKRLIAALFYFEPDRQSSEGIKKTGTIHCRLSSGMRDSFTKLVNAGPKFRVRDRSSAHGPATENLKLNFDVQTFSSSVAFNREATQWAIEMGFPKWSSWEPISGFASQS